MKPINLQELKNITIEAVLGTFALLSKLGSALSLGLFGPKPTPVQQKVAKWTRHPDGFTSINSVNQCMSSINDDNRPTPKKKS